MESWQGGVPFLAVRASAATTAGAKRLEGSRVWAVNDMGWSSLYCECARLTRLTIGAQCHQIGFDPSFEWQMELPLFAHPWD